jgi:hypothetical protein
MEFQKARCSAFDLFLLVLSLNILELATGNGPCLMAMHPHPIESTLSDNGARACTLVAKLVQSLANLSTFGVWCLVDPRRAQLLQPYSIVLDSCTIVSETIARKLLVSLFSI